MPSNLLVRHVFVVFDVVRVGCEDAYEESDVHAEAEEGEEYAGDGLVLENGHLLLVVASVNFAVGVARRQDGNGGRDRAERSEGSVRLKPE